MSPERFDTGTSKTGSSAGAIQFGEFLGRRAVYLPSGLLTVKGAHFRDGAVEADVASKPGGLFIGIAFRIESEANLEMIYLRPGASDTIEAMQYTPLNGTPFGNCSIRATRKPAYMSPKTSGFI
jgi:hypothetical protein